MSRPTTRSKNKRHRPIPDVDTTSEILRKIHATGEITDGDLKQLYKISKPICQGCRVNTKDNPNCFCALIPPPNGSRKSGLWQKVSDIVEALGPDPCKDLRVSAASPAGLTNLGATCYANSILQCLYMNKSFREGVFSVEPDVLKQHPVLDELTRLFAQLHASNRAFIDSAPFIKTLELDNGVQQDSHEFLTLLLSLLERCLSHSNVSKARTIVQDLFRGNVSHVTTCSKCGRDSEASAKMEDFYELELNVKGLKTLDESLDDYLSLEELHGDNQYFCDSCGTRVDATRSIKLRSLPDVLNFQLKRCIFLPKTTMKKKITSPFCFPGELNMQRRLSEPSQLDLTYDLSAVLIHKGTAVNSGHYIALIKDENTGQWWEFDDEHVSNLGHHPFGEGSSSSGSKVVRSEPVVCQPVSERVEGANENHVDVHLPSSEYYNGSNVERFTSNDAYMLMYNLRRDKEDSKREDVVHDVNNMEIESEMIFFNDDIFLPSHLGKDIKELNRSYLDGCEQFKLRKNRELDCISERKQEVRSLLSEAPVPSLEEPFYWISSDWLRQWADKIFPSTLDNTSIQCLHGKVPESKIGSMKRISSKAWNKFFFKYNGGPALTNDDYCMTCLIDGAHTVVCADSYRDRRKSLKGLADDVLSGKLVEGTYYVSKSWLQQWTRRKNLDAPSEADGGPTTSIRCPHGQLMPEKAGGAKRLLVPEILWLFIYEDAMKVKPDDLLGCSTFPLDSEEYRVDISARKLKERQNHEKLALGKSIPLSLDCKYYLLPSTWLTKWRNYISASGKNASSIEPEILDGVIDSLKCEKHLRLLERPPDLFCKRGSIYQKGSATDGLTIVTENDWKWFCEEWGGIKEKGLSVIVDFSNNAGNELVGPCKEILLSEEPCGPRDEENNEIESQRPVVRTFPEICEDCIGERESCELMQKLNYCDKDISVFLVRGKEAPRSILEASESMFEPDRRASKRSRKTRSFVNLKVSASTSIYQLKMMIWESLGVVKENQILHKGQRIIDQECATLADLNIFPGDKLWVQDSEIHEHRDIADELSDQKMNVQHVEEGFRGTLLTSNLSSQVV
ncbi:ubiquitin carboxyl-terminal hydrolase 26 [Citrus clementina]|nr:ubiquitin carboxyl-terminal hydrolase 26 [Citrus x clementina]